MIVDKWNEIPDGTSIGYDPVADHVGRGAIEAASMGIHVALMTSPEQMRWAFDAVTVNPYQGLDSVEPFLNYTDRATFIICRTSNPSARDFQDLLVDVDGERMPLYQAVALRCEDWNLHDNVGLVVGATYPEELQELRGQHPRMSLLIPGVGAQGGDVQLATRYGLDVDGGTPAAMLATMRSDTQRWAELIKATGIAIPQ